MAGAAKKTLSELTAADVIDAALEQIGTKDGFDDQHFFATADGSRELGQPGPNVGATCAIGGVEQALWRLTGRIVTEERLAAAYPCSRRYGALRHPRSTTSKLYFQAMTILNRVALRTRVAWKFESDGCPIEQLTFVADHKAVVRAFKRALIEAKAQAPA